VTRFSILAVVALAAACDRPSSEHEGGRSRSEAQDRAARATPGYVVDSALPPAELLRRFRAGIDSIPTTLNGPGSREALVKQFFVALERRDIREVQSLVVDKAEFAYLVFPDSRQSLPPFNQSPEIAWLLMQSSSNKSLGRLLQRAGGGQVRYLEHSCATTERDGLMWVHGACTVRVFVSGQYVTRQLFGAIVEHGGRYKLLSFDNDY
jgi:hypothetical protein